MRSRSRLGWTAAAAVAGVLVWAALVAAPAVQANGDPHCAQHPDWEAAYNRLAAEQTSEDGRYFVQRDTLAFFRDRGCRVVHREGGWVVECPVHVPCELLEPAAEPEPEPAAPAPVPSPRPPPALDLSRLPSPAASRRPARAPDDTAGLCSCAQARMEVGDSTTCDYTGGHGTLWEINGFGEVSGDRTGQTVTVSGTARGEMLVNVRPGVLCDAIEVGAAGRRWYASPWVGVAAAAVGAVVWGARHAGRGH